MKAEQIHRVYFIGVGGIGMSALARYYNHKGLPVAGYDRVSTALTRELVREGMLLHYQDDPRDIPEEFTCKEHTLVVYTPAVPPDHNELAHFRSQGFRVMKRSEVLGMITAGKKCIAVAGTHGKTTISSWIAHMMSLSGIPCDAFLGGISKNLGSNVMLSDGPRYVVTEADEFDRSFLQLKPHIGVVTSMDSDHLDVYGSGNEMIRSFRDFTGQITGGGKLLVRKDLEKEFPVRSGLDLFTYGHKAGADIYPVKYTRKKNSFRADIHTPRGIYREVPVGIPGRMNLENALATVAVGNLMELDDEVITGALGSFRGVVRRFDIIFSRGERIYIDDYAHHPREIEYLIRSVREIWPGKKITGVFQPHLYSRTRDFAAEFAAALDLLDELFLLDIYPAREEPIEGVGPETILEHADPGKKKFVSGDRLLDELKKTDLQILLTMGAGDIDRMVEPIRIMLETT